MLFLLASAALVSAATGPTARAAAPTCWGAEDRSRSFDGTISTTDGAILEQIGRRGSERIVQKSYGDLRVCMVTYGFDGDADARPSQWLSRSDRVILETRTSDDVRTLDVNSGRVTYTVNGTVQP